MPLSWKLLVVHHSPNGPTAYIAIGYGHEMCKPSQQRITEINQVWVIVLPGKWVDMAHIPW